MPVSERSNPFQVTCGGDLAITDELICTGFSFDSKCLFEQGSFSQKKVVLPGMAYNILIYGEDIYYTYGLPGRVYRKSANGLPRPLTLKRVHSLTVQDGKMFYIDPTDDGLYISNGSVLKTRIADSISCYTVIDNQVFYIEYETYSLNVYDISTKQHTCIHTGEIRNIVSDGEFIYYTCYDYSEGEGYTNGKLYRAKLDGSDPQLLLEQVCWNVYLYKDDIFYRNQSDRGNMYRVHKDGTDNRLLFEGNIGEYYIWDEKVLFRRITTEKNGIPDGYYLGSLDGQEETTIYNSYTE